MFNLLCGVELNQFCPRSPNQQRQPLPCLLADSYAMTAALTLLNHYRLLHRRPTDQRLELVQQAGQEGLLSNIQAGRLHRLRRQLQVLRMASKELTD